MAREHQNAFPVLANSVRGNWKLDAQPVSQDEGMVEFIVFFILLELVPKWLEFLRLACQQSKFIRESVVS
jgi:hypothetical protein